MVGYYRLSSDLQDRTHIRFGCPTCDLACSFRCAGGMDCGRTVIRGWPLTLVRKAASRSSVQVTSRAIAGNGGAARLARLPSTRWHWAHQRPAISLPETGSPAAHTDSFAIIKAPLNVIIAQTMS